MAPRSNGATQEKSAGIVGSHMGRYVATAKGAGYTGLSNGDLIRRAAADGFDVLVKIVESLRVRGCRPG